MAADDVCEHHYETRILGGRPISVAACVYCRTPDWADLDEQAAELYQWGWQEGRDGKTAREKLSAYDKPRQAHNSPHAPQDGPQRPDAGAETPDGTRGRQTGAGGRETLREQYAAAIAELPYYERDDAGSIADAVLAVRDRELERLEKLHQAHLRVEQRLAGQSLAAEAAVEQIRLHIAAHRPRLQYADPILLGRLEAVLRQVGELEAAGGGEGA